MAPSSGSRSSFWQHIASRAFQKHQAAGGLDKLAWGNQNDSTTDGGEHFAHLKRQLTLFELTAMGIGGSIGAGVFTLTGIAAAKAGPAVTISFCLAGLVAGADALCFAEMASRFPEAGSVYLYAYISFGQLPALLIAVNLLCDYHIAAALIARSFGIYLVQFLQHTGLESVPTWLSSIDVNEVVSISLIAPLLLLFLTLVLARGAEFGARVNIVLTSIKMAIIVLVCAVGLFHLQPGNWVPFFPKGIGAVFPTTSTVFFSYVGFDTIASSSEECKDPLRDLPRAIMLSLGVCVALYSAVCFVITGMVPYDQIDLSAPLSSAFRGLGLTWVQSIISFGGVVGLATTLLIGLYAQARIYLGITRDHLLPPALADVHPTWKTPAKAQALCGAAAMLLSGLFNVKMLAEILDIGVIIGYGTVCASVLVQRSPEKPRTTRHLALLVAAAALPFTLLKYNLLGPTLGFLSLLLPAAALVPLIRHTSYPAPAAGVAFACPFVPWVPLAGVLLNVYLSVELSLSAWLRLLVVWALLLGYYVWSEKHYHSTGKERGGAARGGGGGRLGLLLDRGDSVVLGSTSPSESLRRRSSRMSASGGGGGGGAGGGVAGVGGSPLRRPLILDDGAPGDDMV